MVLTDTNPQDTAVTDDQLVALAQAGDEEAFECIAERYTALLNRLSAQYGAASAVEEDDLAQEGLLGLLSAVNTYRAGGVALFSTYAHTCMRNRMISAIRRVRGTPPMQCIEDEPAVQYVAPKADPETLLVRREELTGLRARLRSALSDTEYQVLMRYLGSYSYEEIADALALSRKAVDNALQRARRKLAASPYLFRR